MPSHVGQVIMSTTLDTAAKVHAIYGGTWEAWGKGRVPVGVDPNDTDFNAPNKSGGAKTVTLTVEQIPAHQHGARHLGSTSGSSNGWIGSTGTKSTQMTDSTGGGQAHNNMQPYQTLYMWKRTA